MRAVHLVIASACASAAGAMLAFGNWPGAILGAVATGYALLARSRTAP